MITTPTPGTPRGRALATASHLAVGVPWGAVWTIVIWSGLGAGIVAFPVGVPVAAATLLLVPLGAELERDRARHLLGARPQRSTSVPAGRLLQRLRVHARSSATWLEAAHLATFGPLAALALAVIAAWAVATGAALTSAWWLPIGSVPLGPLEVPRPLLVTLLAVNGAAALLAGPTVWRSVGAVHRGIVARLLGAGGWRTRVAEAEQRQALLARAARAERERIERDLHDGLQPMLVSTAVTIAGARRAIATDAERADRDLEEAQALLRSAMDDVRSLVQGLAPRSLRESGLDAALGELAAGIPMSTELDVDVTRDVDEEVATAAYFVASEAVTNAVRHGAAGRIAIRVASSGDRLDVSVVDDGIGGATPRLGRGLDGLDARVRAVGGEFRVESPSGVGTTVRASLPIGDRR